MKDRTIMFGIVAVLAVIMLSMFAYVIFVQPAQTEKSAADLCGTGTTYDATTGKCITSCGTGTIYDATTGKCITSNQPQNPVVTQCQIPATALNQNFLEMRQTGDPATYWNSTYDVFQFGTSVGVVAETKGTSGGKGSAYDSTLTRLTPGYPITIWYGTNPIASASNDDVWGGSDTVDVACQASVSHTSKIWTLGDIDVKYFNINGEYKAYPDYNETVAAGDTIAPSFKLKEASESGAVGNPGIQNPIGFCFGYNTSEVLHARIVDGTSFPVPSALSGVAFECYQWNHPALTNLQSASIDLSIQLKRADQGVVPKAGDVVDVYMVTQNYYKNGNGDYVTAWENDASGLLGLGSATPLLTIGLY